MTQRNLKQTLSKLFTKHHLLSVTKILELLDEKGKSYNKTSVYRALDQLMSDQVICKHFFDDDVAMYELREDHHVHLVCERCGCVEVGECTYDHPETVGDFKVSHHHLTLMGVCGKCARVV